MEKYIKIKENSAKITHLHIELIYSLGGMNYFTGRTECRGYYLSVRPVSKGVTSSGNVYESYTAFSGIERLVKKVTRKSKNAETEAEKLSDDFVDDLITFVCKKNNIELDV